MCIVPRIDFYNRQNFEMCVITAGIKREIVMDWGHLNGLATQNIVLACQRDFHISDFTYSYFPNSEFL